MLSALGSHVPKLKYLINSNSTTILTAAGVVGTVGTAVLTARATFKAADIIAKKKTELEEDLKFPETEVASFSKTEKVQMVWHQYIPAVGVGVLTVTSIVAAHRISSGKIAALAAAAGISERALQEYKEKVLEKVGPKQEEKIRDEIAQDHVTKNPPTNGPVIISGSGDVLCFDDLTGRYFYSTIEKIKKAENNVNFSIIQDDYCSLSYFFDEIGLHPTTYSDMVGWNVNTKGMEVTFSTTMTEDSRPCLVLGYNHIPVSDYDKPWAIAGG